MVHNHTCRQNTHTPTPPKPNMRPTTVKLAQQTIKSFSLLDLTVVLYQRHRQQYKTNKQTKPTAFHMMRTFWVANIHYQNNKRQLQIENIGKSHAGYRTKIHNIQRTSEVSNKTKNLMYIYIKTCTCRYNTTYRREQKTLNTRG